MLFPFLLARGLNRVLKMARKDTILLGDNHRYVIFSDHHKGADSDADDFKKCKNTYLTALNHYHDDSYKLIILGDAEELWEENIEDVLSKYPDVFASEARFHRKKRYLRIFGNHDSNWGSSAQVEKHLHHYFPGLEVAEGLVFSYHGADQASSGELFLVHGHQGTLDSEIFARQSRFIVRTVWRTLQILGKGTGTTPGNSDRLRGKHDTLMYKWAKAQDSLLLLAGHTHRAIWSSRTPLEQKLIEHRALNLANEIVTVPDYKARLTKIKKEIELLKTTQQKTEDMLKTRGCYFNDGCCSFKDGSVTAYELHDGELRLVRWEGSNAQRQVLDKERLSELFLAL